MDSSGSNHALKLKKENSVRHGVSWKEDSLRGVIFIDIVVVNLVAY